jgi:hypothetical protein
MGVVAHACNLTLRRLKQEGRELEASLAYIAIFCLKKKKREIEVSELC